MTTEPTVTTPRPEGGAAQKGSVEFADARADPVATRGKVIAATANTDSYSSPSEAYTSVSGGSSAVAAGEDGDSGVDGGARSMRGATKKSSAMPPTGGSGGGGQGSSVGGKGGKAAAHGVGNHKPVSRLAPPILLLLAGLPGSGKSTFSRELLAASPVAWVHVNQDAIRGGKPGTRQQCISAVRIALEQGACCVVDRCHADADQRSAMRTVASDLGFAAHCVALQTPLELCVKRVAGRSDHPGGVQGEGSKKVVYMAAGQMKGNNWPPVASEGFASVMDCHNDADAAAAVRAWALYGRHGGDEAQTYGSIKAPALTAATAGTDDGNRNNETKPRPPAVTIAVPATHGSAKIPQKASASADADVAAAATLAMWSEYVAKRKPVSTGIMSFFKRAGTAGKQGPGGGGAAGAAMPAPKVVAFGLREMNGSEARGAAAPGGGVTAAPAGATAQANQDSKVAAMGKGPREAGGKGSPASGTVTLSGQRRPRTETAAAVAEERREKRRDVDLAQAGRGSDVAAVGGADAAAGKAGNRSVGSLQVRVKDAAGSERQGHGESVAQCSDSPAARNAFAVLMASASRQAADGHGGTSGGGGSGGDGAGPKQPKHRGGAATGESSDLHSYPCAYGIICETKNWLRRLQAMSPTRASS
ncbi:hypothetical protein Vretifemale_17710 [Volvox reticuliferus]|uniref:Uncharacterized protein n=1 Tax=Volvox reticuliferus TaxID=1737510 RepID=A0A8J4CVU9_9CHLO|nr:hypothetical protein Vretifemale_17710 [Volvox reticuliferus]